MLEAEYLTHVLALIGTLNIPEKFDHVWYIEYNNQHHQKWTIKVSSVVSVDLILRFLTVGWLLLTPIARSQVINIIIFPTL